MSCNFLPFRTPQLKVKITMELLSMSLTKGQYQCFVMLLERLEYMRRAADYQKYKARCGHWLIFSDLFFLFAKKSMVCQEGETKTSYTPQVHCILVNLSRTPTITKEWKNDQTCARYGLEENDKFSYKRYLIPCTSQSCNNSNNCDTCGPRGRHVRRNLWNFAHDCVELEVKRKLTNWSWKHIKEHVNKVQSITWH